MKKKQALSEFEKLGIEEKRAVIGTLQRTKQSYILSGVQVDVPYFFWSVNPVLFAGIDPAEFLEITESYEFGVQAVYYISRYINEKRGTA